MSLGRKKSSSKNRAAAGSAAKVATWVAIVSGVVGLGITIDKVIERERPTPLQQIYVTLSGNCLNSFINTGLIKQLGKDEHVEYVESFGLGKGVRASIEAVRKGNARSIDEATFLLLKNVSTMELRDLKLTGPDLTGSVAHVLPGSQIAIGVRTVSINGVVQEFHPARYHIVPIRGWQEEARIDPFDLGKTALASASNDCTVLGYPPDPN